MFMSRNCWATRVPIDRPAALEASWQPLTDKPRHAVPRSSVIRRVRNVVNSLSTERQHRPEHTQRAPGSRRTSDGVSVTLSVDEIFTTTAAMGATARDVTDVTGNIFISHRCDRRVVRRATRTYHRLSTGRPHTALWQSSPASPGRDRL